MKTQIITKVMKIKIDWQWNSEFWQKRIWKFDQWMNEICRRNDWRLNKIKPQWKVAHRCRVGHSEALHLPSPFFVHLLHNLCGKCNYPLLDFCRTQHAWNQATWTKFFTPLISCRDRFIFSHSECVMDHQTALGCNTSTTLSQVSPSCRGIHRNTHGYASVVWEGSSFDHRSCYN